MAINEIEGDNAGLLLAKLVRRFRARLRSGGIGVEPGLFPIQTIETTGRIDPVRLHDRLLEAGVSAILRRGAQGEGPRLSFIVTAAHSLVDVESCCTGRDRYSPESRAEKGDECTRN